MTDGAKICYESGVLPIWNKYEDKCIAFADGFAAVLDSIVGVALATEKEVKSKVNEEINKPAEEGQKTRSFSEVDGPSDAAPAENKKD